MCYNIAYFMFWVFLAKKKKCMMMYGILAPQPGMEHMPPALYGEVLTTGPPGKSLVNGLLHVLSSHTVNPFSWWETGDSCCFIDDRESKHTFPCRVRLRDLPLWLKKHPSGPTSPKKRPLHWPLSCWRAWKAPRWQLFWNPQRMSVRLFRRNT